MLGKLSIRNAKRQARDYVIYFITVIISVALMFSFNCIAVSQDISELSSFMEYFSKSITVISIIIIFIMAWLINYTMKFMLEKRSKEFGTYQILGLEKKDISNMFTLENMIIGIIAFVVGIAVGTFLYQILTSIIMNLFNQPYEIKIDFSVKAIGITAIYFFGIFVLVLWNCRRKIQKTKVYDLLYADKKNENNKIESAKGNIILFILSLILLISAWWINDREFKMASNMTGRNILIAIIMLISGIYLFYISLSSFIVKRYLSHKTRKYKKDNMFLFRNLTSKINTMSVTMGTIALMFTIILIGSNVALLLNGMLNNEIEMGYPFEIMISSANGDFSEYKDYIQKNVKVKDMYEYRIYYIPSTTIVNALQGTSFEGSSREKIEYVMACSDYNRLREILGYEKVELEQDEIMINCIETAQKTLEEYGKENPEIEILGTKAKIKEVKSDNLAQMGFNGYIYTIIVPDSLIGAASEEDARLRNEDTEEGIYYFDFGYKLVAQTEQMTDEAFYHGLSDLIETEERQMVGEYEGEKQEYSMEIALGSVQTKGERMSETKSFYAIVSFLAFYIALIFVMGAATLLAIQQLSDSEKYKYRYDLLKKLGMDELQINRIILKQLFFYFAIPMIIPILISIPVILSVSNIFTIAVPMEEIIRNIVMVLGMFLLVYGIYFIATDVQFTRNIDGID